MDNKIDNRVLTYHNTTIKTQRNGKIPDEIVQSYSN